MKRIYYFGLVLGLMLSTATFVSCGSDDEKSNPENENVVTNNSEDKKTNDESDKDKEDNSNDNKSDDTSDTPAQDAVEAIQLWADGPKWANMNVGATSVTDYGLFFAWGETTGYSSDGSDWHNFSWGDYKYGYARNLLTKYNGDPSLGKVDSRFTLTLGDDAAYENWGSSWRMPTSGEFHDLLYNTDYRWTSNYKNSGVAGCVFTGKDEYSDKSIFLPAAGWQDGRSVLDQGSIGHYWSSSVGSDWFAAAQLFLYSSDVGISYSIRCNGHSVRAVKRY